jgi:hypothetical protein
MLVEMLPMGGTVTVMELAERHARMNGALSALNDVHRARLGITRQVRERLGIEVVPITDTWLDREAAGTPPETDADVTACVAGAGGPDMGVGWYRPMDGTDVMAVRSIRQRAATKSLAQVLASQERLGIGPGNDTPLLNG